MSALDRSKVWPNLARALAQLAPLAENGAVTPDDRTRALDHLALVSQANSTLLERKELTRYEARLIESEITRLRGRLQQPAPAPAGRLPQPDLPSPAQAAFGRLNKLQSALSKMAESGECRREVLRCVQHGLKSDLAILANPQQVNALPEDIRERVPALIRETQRCLQTIAVQQEIQAAVNSAPASTSPSPVTSSPASPSTTRNLPSSFHARPRRPLP